MITVQLQISVVKSRNILNVLYCNTVDLLQNRVCSTLSNNIAISHILVPSLKHNCHYNRIQSLLSDAFEYQFLSEMLDFET